ncbi:MAG: hypothetical protein KGV50_01200 [Gammaproteobacteria bacterium]|nr:hypothetical protein [Gammaproteobacteria bacterium]
MKIKKIIYAFASALTFCLPNVVTADSKMPKALAETNLSSNCKEIITNFSEDIIGPKKHRILVHENPHAPFFQAFILLGYNDQDSHVTINAVPMGKQCEVSYKESFEINVPCDGAREALFKRWQLIGKLSNTTMVLRYDHPRNKKILPANEKDRAFAYLTQTRRGESCLVTKQQQHIQIYD